MGGKVHFRAVRVIATSQVRHVVEDGKELVVFLLADGVVLVVVALGTFQGQSQPGPSRGLEPVNDRLDPEFLLAGIVSLGLHGIAMKSGCDLFSHSAFWNEVPRNLLDGELVKRLVGVDGVDDPVAIDPHVPGPVGSIA